MVIFKANLIENYSLIGFHHNYLQHAWVLSKDSLF
jgi:hypothetical protein